MFKKLALLALATVSVAAYAAPITGGISINGTDSYNNNSITFLAPGNVGTSTLPGVTACTACVALPGSPFFFDSNFTPGFIYQVNNATGTVLTSLYINSILPGSGMSSNAPLPGTTLTINGSGTLFLSGYDPTPGFFTLTSQNLGQATVTFSASSIATAVTPEPSSLMLLGTGLLGAAGVARRKLGF